MKSLPRTVQAALTEIQSFDVPLRVLVSEPDNTSRRLISAVLQSNSVMTVTCVEDSQLLPTIERLLQICHRGSSFGTQGVGGRIRL